MKNRFLDAMLVVAVLTVLLALPAWAQETPQKPEQPPAQAPLAAALAAGLAPGATAPMVTKARIFVEEKAKNDGRIEVIFTPEKGQPVTVSVLVATKMKGKEVAEDLAKNLKVTLGATYKVNASGERIEINGKNKQKFSLVMGSNTVSGMSVKIE